MLSILQRVTLSACHAELSEAPDIAQTECLISIMTLAQCTTELPNDAVSDTTNGDSSN